MDFGISAARWAVDKALGLATDELVKSWRASSDLGQNVRALKRHLLNARVLLDNARERDVRSGSALEEQLLQLGNIAYNADDVLDEIEYFRIQDQLEGTHETADDGCGIIRNLRHTVKDIVSKLNPSCLIVNSSDANETQEDAPDMDNIDGDLEASRGCVAKIFSSAHNTVGKCIPCSSSSAGRDDAPKLKFNRVEISKRMADIVDELSSICADITSNLQLVGFHHISSQATPHNRPETTPEIIEPKLYGRDDQKKNVVEKIVHNAADLTVLSIVGPGGIGKTTFTQHIYDEVKAQFHVPIWICVSTDFSASRLRQEIIKQIPGVKEENKNESDQELIIKGLQSKKFILVLDDIWKCSDDEWQKLLAPFKKGGTKGNIVIVTTRFPSITKTVRTSNDFFIRLERLEENDSMKFFEVCVFGDQQPWNDNHAILEKVGKDIVHKLKGSPLAIKTVGRLLGDQLTYEYWNRVLESREWELRMDENDIMPALKLSYNYLPFGLQQCFSYCALFPEDYEFKSTELIQLWIGLGLLRTGDQNKRYEDIGEDYLNDLVGYGFFQMTEQDGASPWYVIHDLLHELAVNVSSHECLSISSHSNVRSIKVSPSIRHLSIIVEDRDVEDRTTFDNYKLDLSIFGKRLRAENLRTLMIFGEHHGSFLKTLGKMFKNAKALRVLSVSNPSPYSSCNMEDLLLNFSKLIHLRYLRISPGGLMNNIHAPSCISRFYHLMVLDLRFATHIYGESINLSNLVQIRHICTGIMHICFEVGKLKSLQELATFYITKEKSGVELKQLGDLPQLRGSLEIFNLERVKSIEEADEGKLAHMKHLHELTLNWSIYRSNKDPIQENDVLEGLKPPSELRKLCIRGHGGSTCPSWLRADLSVRNLDHLCLHDVDWKCLPPIGDLCMVTEHGEECNSYITSQIFQNLKRIELVNIPRIKRWRINGTSCKLLAHLEELQIHGCPQLVELPFSDSASGPAKHEETMTCFLPKLRSVTIKDCPLLSLPPIPFSNALSCASISQGGIDIFFSSKARKLSVEPVMEENYALDSTYWNMLAFSKMREIETFTIRRCPPVPPVHMQNLASLKALHIQSCYANGKELTQFLSYFPNLTRLVLWGCNEVTQLGVAEKQVRAIPVVASSALVDESEDDARIQQQQQEVDQGLLLLPTQIEDLEISDCYRLKLYSSSFETSSRGLLGLASLRRLHTSNCFQFLSSWSSSCCPFPSSLQYLNLQSGSGEGTYTLAPLTNLTKLFISGCDGLRGDDLLHLLARGVLTKLTIYGSPKLDVGSEPPRTIETSTLMEVRTDDITTTVLHICTRFSCSLTKLYIFGNEDMECFTQDQEEAFQSLTSLQTLEINSCKKLQSLPRISGLCSLKTLRIMDCQAILSLPKDGLPNSLTELHIMECLAIQLLPKDGLPDSLIELHISICPASHPGPPQRCTSAITSSVKY